MVRLTAFYDANVLYPAELRNFLMHLALCGLFRAKWSNQVHEEWISNLLQKRPDLTRKQLDRTRMLMDKHAEDALVTGYQHLIPTLQLPDSNDRHVLAAAIHARANVIVTLNLRHFPAVALSPYGVEPKHPDAFIVGLLNRSVAAVVSAAQDHRLSLKNPPRSTAEYLDTLAKQGLAETACILAGHLK